MTRYLVESEANKIRQALLAMYRRCDGGTSRDGKGYSKRDTEFGRSLGRQVKKGKSLTRKQLMSGLRMLQKYRDQLEEEGIHIPYMEEPLANHLKSARHCLQRSMDAVEDDEEVSRQYMESALTVIQESLDRIEGDIGR